MKKIVLCAAVGFAASGAGLAVFYAGHFLGSIVQEQKRERVEKSQTVAIEPKKIEIGELIYPKQHAAVKTVEKQTGDEKSRFDPTGDYNIFDPTGDYYIIGGALKLFDNFDYLTVETMNYKGASGENNWEAEPIPPRGYMEKESGKKLDLARVFISGKQISFETETKKGISYKFVGKFIEGKEVKWTGETDYAVLEGVLHKLENGQEIASRIVQFGYIHGC